MPATTWAGWDDMMSTFLLTKHNIGQGLGIGSWSPAHFAWLAAGLAFTLLLCHFYKAGDGKRRAQLCWAMAVLVMADEILKYVFSISTGQWSWEFLPLHLCSLSAFVILAHAITHSENVAEYLYALDLPAALMALVFPNWTMLPCMNWESIHSFSIHILLAAYPCMLLAGGWRPRFQRLKYSIIPFAIAVIVAVTANHFLDTNFFFLNGSDSGNPLSFLQKYLGWGYLIGFPVIAAALWSVMYLLIPRVLKWR